MGEAVTRVNATRHRQPARSRRRIWIRRSIIALGLVIVLVVGGVVADYYYLGSLVHRVAVTRLQSSDKSENILLIGSTDRCALKVQNAAYGYCSTANSGVNSDIVMILHLVPATHTV